MLPDMLGGLSAMGDTPGRYWTPTSPDGIRLRLEPGEAVLFTGCCRATQRQPAAWQLAETSVLYVTDRRTVVLDPRQGGPGEAGCAQVRHEWLTRVSQRKVRALIGVVDNYLDLTVAGAGGPIVVELFGKQVTDVSFAHWFAGLVAGHRLSLSGGLADGDAETLQRYLSGQHDTLPPSGRSTGLTWGFPGDPARLIALAGGPSDAPQAAPGQATPSRAVPGRSTSVPGDEHLEELSRKAVARAERGGRRALQEAVKLFRQVLEATPRQSVDRPRRLSNLYLALRMLFEETGDLVMQEECIDILREAWTTARKGGDGLAEYAVNLSTELLERFELVEDMALLLEAESTMRDTEPDVRADHPDLPSFFGTYGNVLQGLYERKGDAQHILSANKAHRSALSSLPPHHEARAVHLSSLGATLALSFKAVGDLAFLRESVEVQRQVLAVVAPGDPVHFRTSVNLSHALQLLAERTGDVEALTEAVQLARDAWDSCHRSDPDAVECASALASALTDLFTRTGDLPTLLQAVEVRRTAVAASPRKSLTRSMALGNLASTVSTLYERTLDLHTLEEARRAGRDSIDALPPGDPNRAHMESNHGVTMMLLYQTSSERDHLAEAVELHRSALEGVRTDHPDRAPRLSNLGLALQELYAMSGDERYAEESARVCGEAAFLTRRVEPGLPDHPDHPGYLYTLGTTLRLWADRTSDETRKLDLLSKARQAFGEAAEFSTGPVRVQLAAHHGLGWAAMMQGDSQPALTAYEHAVQILPQIASPRLRRADREHGLSGLAGLAAEAASAAIAAGRPARAVELLEQARGVLLSELLEVRGGLAELRLHAPELAEQLTHLREELDRTKEGGQTPPELDRRRTEQKWELLLEQVRAIPGFEEFLLPVPILHLQPEALDGPVVLVNISSFRGDALILTSDVEHPVRLLELADVTRKDVLARIKILHASLSTVAAPNRSERAAAHTSVQEVMSWIWEAITSPVLTALGFTATLQSENLPRIWWCPIGEIAFLPLHAAGPQSGADGALDRVISSYTPTVRALGHARRARIDSAATALVITMPETPDQASLPFTAQEAEALSAILPSITVITGADATHQAVVNALPQHRIAHFSCHGHSDWSDPSTSSLLLHDHLTRPLTVAALSQLQLTGADLAFLSACSTSQSSLRLADEAVHITSALQMAGFTHVVGTLWPIDDGIALEVSRNFYEALTAGASAPPDVTDSARALNAAIRRLRENLATYPALWAAHLHTGP